MVNVRFAAKADILQGGLHVRYVPIADVALVAIAGVHSDNRFARTFTLTLFATGIALSVLLIAAYSRPFTSVGPELLKQVIASEVPFGG